MALADAKAAFPHIEVLERDLDKDKLLLEAIADWCDRYTPLVAIDRDTSGPGQYGLTLDITGCAHLFGGERALMQDLMARLFHQGFCARAAVAPSPGAAWAFSHFQVVSPGEPDPHASPLPVLTSREVEAALMPLPLAALRLGAASVNALARLGLRTIGQLKRRPRAPLVRRFGHEPLLRLDQATGAIEEAISPRRAIPRMIAERRLPEPLVLESDIEAVTKRLAGHLSEDMEKRGQGARQLQLVLYRVDGKTLRLDAGTSRPERNPQTITRLFRERFSALGEDFDAGFGFETIRLCVLSCEPFKQESPGFLGDDPSAGRAAQRAEELIDRIAARIGFHNILRGRLEDTHLPECAETLEPVHQPLSKERRQKEADISTDDLAGLRPLRLFEIPEPVEAVAEVPEGPPIRFRWRKVLHKVVRVEGPERIADTWWAKQDPRYTRDYFRIEDEEGRRYWLFREGLYERETSTPRWFLHGQFA
jgi:protein ImuB